MQPKAMPIASTIRVQTSCSKAYSSCECLVCVRARAFPFFALSLCAINGGKRYETFSNVPDCFLTLLRILLSFVHPDTRLMILNYLPFYALRTGLTRIWRITCLESTFANRANIREPAPALTLRRERPYCINDEGRRKNLYMKDKRPGGAVFFFKKRLEHARQIRLDDRYWHTQESM